MCAVFVMMQLFADTFAMTVTSGVVFSVCRFPQVAKQISFKYQDDFLFPNV